MYKGHGRSSDSIRSVQPLKPSRKMCLFNRTAHPLYQRPVDDVSKAIEAGDIIDTVCLFALGTSQPPTEPQLQLEGTEYDTGLDLNLLSEIAGYFRPIREKYLESSQLIKSARLISTLIWFRRNVVKLGFTAQAGNAWTNSTMF